MTQRFKLTHKIEKELSKSIEKDIFYKVGQTNNICRTMEKAFKVSNNIGYDIRDICKFKVLSEKDSNCIKVLEKFDLISIDETESDPYKVKRMPKFIWRIDDLGNRKLLINENED